ncbi:MAG: hypothetical protein QGH51_05015 [Planctomycetota bacterium]|jgi:hypothetical protein|nr:hypothetical protein [Planctomycetota bacterium]MDP6941373.1 hypothetical protein [Planctomycetota bacterium]
MDDRNLVAVAEQAAATSRVVVGPIAGCTVKGDDGRVFRGCLLEYEESNLNQDPIANGIAAGRAEGMRRVARIGYYSPTGGELPSIPRLTLLRLRELAVPGMEIIFSPGTGDRVERTLDGLLAEAGLA